MPNPRTRRDLNLSRPSKDPGFSLVASRKAPSGNAGGQSFVMIRTAVPVPLALPLPATRGGGFDEVFVSFGFGRGLT